MRRFRCCNYMSCSGLPIQTGDATIPANRWLLTAVLSPACLLYCRWRCGGIASRKKMKTSSEIIISKKLEKTFHQTPISSQVHLKRHFKTCSFKWFEAKDYKFLLACHKIAAKPLGKFVLKFASSYEHAHMFSCKLTKIQTTIFKFAFILRANKSNLFPS